jgi:hypothetical protein
MIEQTLFDSIHSKQFRLYQVAFAACFADSSEQNKTRFPIQTFNKESFIDVYRPALQSSIVAYHLYRVF